jgi:hypothetical protein
MSGQAEGVSAPAEVKHLNVRQAAVIGVGSVVGAGIFALLGAAVAHVRIRGETGASVVVLITAIVAAAVVLVTFVFTTLIHEPASIVALVVILVLSIGLGLCWSGPAPARPSRSRSRTRHREQR